LLFVAGEIPHYPRVGNPVRREMRNIRLGSREGATARGSGFARSARNYSGFAVLNSKKAEFNPRKFL
jgi:hypothetical protein